MRGTYPNQSNTSPSVLWGLMLLNTRVCKSSRSHGLSYPVLPTTRFNVVVSLYGLPKSRGRIFHQIKNAQQAIPAYWGVPKSSRPFSLPLLNPKHSIHDVHGPLKKVVCKISPKFSPMFDFPTAPLKPSCQSHTHTRCLMVSRVFHGLFKRFFHACFMPQNGPKSSKQSSRQRNVSDFAICN